MPDEKKAGLIVPPIAVIKIAGDDDEGDLLFDCLTYEIVESNAGRSANAFGSGALVSGQTLERTVKMNVASMDEAKRLLQGRTLIYSTVKAAPISGRHGRIKLGLSYPQSNKKGTQTWLPKVVSPTFGMLLSGHIRLGAQRLARNEPLALSGNEC